MFKVNGKKMDLAVKSFMANPFYKKEYEDAPSDVCKEYIKFRWYWSKYNEPSDEEYAEYRERLWDKFTVDDWKYIQSLSVGTPLWSVCKKHIETLKNKG